MKILVTITLCFSLLFPVYAIAAQEQLVVYSARKEHLIKPLFDAYSKKTGVKIRYITDDAGVLLTRLKAEGKHSPADLLMTVDAGNLWHAAELGVLAPINSPALESSVPAQLRDPLSRWFGLSIRARTIVYSTKRVEPKSLLSYSDLAHERWRGRLCLRTSKTVYNQSLVAMMMHRLGEAQTEAVVRGWVANLAAPPFADDTEVLKAIVAGQCDLGIVNSYYYGRLQKTEADLPLALYWPKADQGGVHVNVSGAGITKSSKNPAAAIALLEWLASPEAQTMYAGLNLEYPVNPAVSAVPQVAAWGQFEADPNNLAIAGELQTKAAMLMDRANYR